MYYFTSDTIAQANKQISTLDAKVGGLLCILHCLTENFEENISYTINGKMLRSQLSVVFDKEPKGSFENVKSSYIIFARGWADSFFQRYIKNKIDLLACSVFFLRRHGFEREYTEEELINTFIKCFNLQQYKERWFFDGHNVTLAYNQGDVEDNQTEFYLKMNYSKDFKSILFSGVIQKSAADLKAAGQIQTLYSGSGVQSCFLLSDEPLEQYYIMSNSDRNVTQTETSGIYDSPFARNRILFGAPGTGKSYTLNKDKEKLLENGGEYERVTFHPDYSYANFVGTYKPVPCKDDDGKDAITYEYVPGPFMRTYVRALQNSRAEDIKPYLVLIEEINRANVAAVFGDVFQLLDRDNNVSEYPIHPSEDIKKYLAKPENLGGNLEDYDEIKIPDNMFIWATMNSADQGVFPMDTAFKRRWDFKYLGIDDNDENIEGKTVIIGTVVSQKLEWNKLRKAINKFLANQKINEDKQLGPYFISKRIVVPTSGNEIDSEAFIETFKNKVIMYLFEDAAKQKRASLFEGCFQNSSRYSEICKEFEEKGIGIFNLEIQVAAEPEDIQNQNDTSKFVVEGNNE